MSFFLFFLLSLGAARVTWLITEDHLPIVANPRQWLVDRNPDGNLAYLVSCWWCVSVYTGAGAAAFAVWVLDSRVVHEDWKSFLVLWPAFSFAAVALMSLVDMMQAHGTED